MSKILGNCPNICKALKKISTGFFIIIFISFFLVLFLGCTKKETPKKVSLYKRVSEVPGKMGDSEEDVLWFGFDLRLDPKEDVRIYTPFLRYLEETTGRHFRIKFNERYEDTVEGLGKGTIHFAAIGSLSYVFGRDRYGERIRYLVSGLNKDGRPSYQAVIFTSPESNIKDIGDLKGKSFAFGSRMSTQGHLIPRKMLEDAGITLEDLSYYVYTGSHINTVKSVLNGECSAGAIQDNLAKRLAREGKIRILKVSNPYPSSLIAYNGDIDNKIVEAVRSALLSFEPRGRHKDMLIDWDKTEMPLGFTIVNEYEFYKVAVLARKYGLLTK
jgi:phosphonate transport system substrate-binding protein